jgi:hypothetical protein
VKPLERLLFSWRWRSRRLALPVRGRGRDTSAYGYALPRDGVPPAGIAAIAIAAIALGALLGTKTGGAAPPTSTVDVLAAPSATASGADDARLRQVIAALSGARLQGRNDLATAKNPSAQAAAALELRRANLRAAAALGSTQKPISKALRRTAAAYAALETAAEKGDRPAFARAATQVEAAERDLERLIGSKL